jgi:hypothetical protein
MRDAVRSRPYIQRQLKRRRHGQTRGRMRTTEEAALRLLDLKHLRIYGCEDLERGVRRI